MSYNNLLKMKCNVLMFGTSQIDGFTQQAWLTRESTRCFLDLNFIRSGKDPVWTPDSGTAQNRSGVLFLPKNSTARPGDRIRMTKGPSGTFVITGVIDEVWTPKRFSHLECRVEEVDRELANG